VLRHVVVQRLLDDLLRAEVVHEYHLLDELGRCAVDGRDGRAQERGQVLVVERDDYAGRGQVLAVPLILATGGKKSYDS
jgi:hypothetical protein